MYNCNALPAHKVPEDTNYYLSLVHKVNFAASRYNEFEITQMRTCTLSYVYIVI
jgi:hypothetical protein